MGSAIATASQADAARVQGGASNLQRFKAHHPPMFTGGGDPMVADHWFRQIERILRAMEITSDTTRITLASFHLEGESQIWWEWVTTSRDLETITWDDFRRLFMGKYFPASARHAKAREFLDLRQGTVTILEYVARFTELARFGDDYVATDAAKVRKFEDGLKLSIRGKIVGHNLQDMDSMVNTALIIEREVDKARSIRDAGASNKKRRNCPQIQGFQDQGTPQPRSSVGHEQTQYVPPYPNMGKGNIYQSQGATRASIVSQTGQRGQSMSRGRGQSVQAGTSGAQGLVFAITPQAEATDQSVIQGMFLLFLLWSRVLFDSGASHSFIAASCVRVLGLEVETLDEPLHVSSPLGTGRELIGYVEDVS